MSDERKQIIPEELIQQYCPEAVQSEIVRILYNFTELTAELTARKKQYEYYQTKLLEQPQNKSQMLAVAHSIDFCFRQPIMKNEQRGAR